MGLVVCNMCTRKQRIYFNEVVIAKIDRETTGFLFSESVLLQRGVAVQAINECIAEILRERTWL